MTTVANRGVDAAVAYRRVPMPGDMCPVVRIEFPGDRMRDYLAALDAAAPGQIERSPGTRVVVPAVGRPSQTIGWLTHWWALLLALSSVARYDPGMWLTALDVDRSPIAVGLERILEQAQQSLPHYVLAPLREE